MPRLKIGDKVRYYNPDGSFDEGIITGALRKDGYYPVRFSNYLWGVQLVKPSHLKKVRQKERRGNEETKDDG